jgi:hypothetical protein
MSDHDKWQALLTDCGIGFDKTTDAAFPGKQFIELKSKEHAKIIGYTGFFALISFDDDGAFIQMEIAE